MIFEKDKQYALDFEKNFDESEIKRKEKDESENACLVCGDKLMNGNYYVILESCKCVTHRECMSGYIDAELAKNSVEIKCLNAASEKCHPNCKKSI